MRNLQAIDLGFDIHRLLVFTLNLRPQGYPEMKVRLMQSQWVERLQALPGVQSASLANGTRETTCRAPNHSRLQ
jgi:hypothetical protein